VELYANLGYLPSNVLTQQRLRLTWALRQQRLRQGQVTAAVAGYVAYPVFLSSSRRIRLNVFASTAGLFLPRVSSKASLIKVW